MSKSSKLNQRERRRKEKAAAKAARRAQYESWRDQGLNSKSFRAKKAERRAKRRTSTRPVRANPRAVEVAPNHYLTRRQASGTVSLKVFKRWA